jgi:hypothetical protein
MVVSSEKVTFLVSWVAKVAPSREFRVGELLKDSKVEKLQGCVDEGLVHGVTCHTAQDEAFNPVLFSLVYQGHQVPLS